VRTGFILPGGTAPEQLELGILAEETGWDGVFVWEAAYGVDAWGLLSALATETERVRLGTVLTPLPWRRPWKVASQVATLDQLSNSRAIITIGVGAITDDLPLAAEVVDLRARADLLDDGIDLMRALWRGDSRYEGAIHDLAFGRPDQLEVVRPIQDRIPIWVVGVWPRMKSMRRVLRCDGVVPQFAEGGHDGSPDQIVEMRRWLAEQRRPDLDVIADGSTSADDASAAADAVRPWADAGCTWWLETNWEMPHHSRERMDEDRARLEAGPPSAP
jgi:alkanesulfonate monooxygenase SsuD/methylene tetrahydromethanopterin reductase-like flavin-dependent oxidoreductase (luciferase family)